MVMDESGMMYLTRWRRTPKRRDDFEGDRSSGFSLHQTKHTQEKRRLKSILGSISHNILSLSLFLSRFGSGSLSLSRSPGCSAFFPTRHTGNPVFPHTRIRMVTSFSSPVSSSTRLHQSTCEFVHSSCDLGRKPSRPKKNRLQRPPLYQKRLEQVTECQSNWLMKHPI